MQFTKFTTLQTKYSRMRALVIGLLCVFAIGPISDTYAQEAKEITLEGIWKSGEFSARRVPGFRFMNDGEHFTKKVGNAIVRYTIVTGEAVDTVFNGNRAANNAFSGKFNSYEFSNDEKKLLIKTESEQIYRRSSKAYFYVYERENSSLRAVYSDDKIMHCTFSA